MLVFGDSSKILLPVLTDVWQIGGATATLNVRIAAVASWAIVTGPWLFIDPTHTGRALQAVSMDLKGTAISGVEPGRTNRITWGLSGAPGALAGVFLASCIPLYPGIGVSRLIISVAVVIGGGIGSIWGTLIVAHVIGFISTALIAAELRGCSRWR